MLDLDAIEAFTMLNGPGALTHAEVADLLRIARAVKAWGVARAEALFDPNDTLTAKALGEIRVIADSLSTPEAR